MSETKRFMGVVRTSPKLLRLLKQSANRTMTREEIAAQRRSWVRGELMLAHPEMTKEEADALIDKDPAS